MAVPIEFRFSDIMPPEADPPKTIYRDVVNLPDPVKLGLTIRYFNYDDVSLYFKIFGAGTGYTINPVELGSLGSGQNAYRNLDEFASRAKPSSGAFSGGEFEEQITLTLKAYTDSGYSNLKWTFERVVTVHWIKSDDPAFTVDYLNNFDDGTVQGWAVLNEQGGSPSLAVATDYVLSTPYSAKVSVSYISNQVRTRLHKNFTTPNKNKVFAIANIREGATYTKNLRIQKDDDILVWLGRPYDDVTQDYVPADKWLRVVVLLPKNTTLNFRIVEERRSTGTRYFWMDDFMIISKD